MDFMERRVRKRLESIGPPQLVTRGQLVVYRFSDRSADTFFLLKWVQIINNLRASRLMIENGFYYECNVLERLISESIEDVTFVLATIDESDTNIAGQRDRLIRSFFFEDFDDKGEPSQDPIRPLQRHQVRSVLASHPASDPQLGQLSENLYRIRSGMVHGRASGIMQMYNPSSSEFVPRNGRGDEARVAMETLSIQAAVTPPMLCSSIPNLVRKPYAISVVSGSCIYSRIPLETLSVCRFVTLKIWMSTTVLLRADETELYAGATS